MCETPVFEIPEAQEVTGIISNVPYQRMAPVGGEAEDAGHPLRNRFAHASSVGDPHGLGDPETAELRGLADEGHTVWSEGEHAVDPIRQVDAAQGWQQVDGVGVSGFEVLRREGSESWLQIRFAVPMYVVGIDEQGLVLVRTNAIAVGMLTEVHGAVLMSQYGVHDLSGFAG
jgi:hypothetical protein